MKAATQQELCKKCNTKGVSQKGQQNNNNAKRTTVQEK
jgi:hypothetical protein